MFKHLHWANLRILETLKNAEEENKQAKNLFSHILHAENIWFTRLIGKNRLDMPIWGEVSLNSCEEMVLQNYHNFNELLSSLTELEVGSYDRWIKYSEHVPLSAVFEKSRQIDF